VGHYRRIVGVDAVDEFERSRQDWLVARPETDFRVCSTVGIDGRISQNEVLARHTTFRIGGPADYFVQVDSRGELIEAVAWGRRKNLDIFILGNGSNILVSDAGIRGMVIENHADAVHEIVTNEGSRDKLVVVAESGASLPGLANRLARQGWSGLEWAIGVPATVGAAVVTNAGAHGGAIGDSLLRAEILDSDQVIRWWKRDELQYDYRKSFLKERAGKYVVLRAELELRREDPTHCIVRMNQYTEHRRRTQPTEPSVGSMFKNPPGDFAGRLIEAAGLKGMHVGSVQVSPVHANFFVNHGGASSRDALQLVELVKQAVRAKFKLDLELEIQLVGDW
jgi:UDP-N-acetylmuramate dehydrogenase